MLEKSESSNIKNFSRSSEKQRLLLDKMASMNTYKQ